MKFSVIIVNDGFGGDMSRALNAVAAQTQRDFEVIVVGADCAMPDDRFKNIAGDSTNAIAAKNTAASMAVGEWLFFITPRTFMADDCLQSLYASTLRHPDCTLFAVTQIEDAATGIIEAAGKCYFFAGIPFCGGKGWSLDVLPDEGEVFGACTPAMFVRKDCFIEINGFDADFVMACEDADLSSRLRLMRHRAILASEAIVFVAEGNPPKDIHRFAARNIIYTYIKNMPTALLWVTLPFHILMLLLLLCNPKHFMARIYGYVDALKSIPATLKKRRNIQATRKASLSNIANALTWNPNIPFWRKTDIQKIK